MLYYLRQTPICIFSWKQTPFHYLLSQFQCQIGAQMKFDFELLLAPIWHYKITIELRKQTLIEKANCEGKLYVH